MEEVLGEMDPIEAEVDAIRLQLYEETKHMTMEERWAYMNERTDPLLKKFNIKVVRPPVIRRTKHPLEDWENEIRKT